MKRREFITLLGSGAATWPFAAHAQQSRMPLIGFLDSRSAEVVGNRLRAFRQGLNAESYTEGQNVAIEYRWAENQIDRLSELVADLVHQSVSVIVASGGYSVNLTAKNATTTIPIVFLSAQDPVELGLVSSLARPGGNLTGINFFNTELAAKQFELLRELLPNATRIAVIVEPNSQANTETTLREVRAAARATGKQVEVFNANNSREIDAAFEAISHERLDAVLVGQSAFLNSRRIQLVQLAARYTIPAAYTGREFTEVGGLISYGSDIADAYRQAGVYCGHILKGAKPGELPVLQSSKLEIVINAQTARMLRLTVPPQLIARSDEVIE